MYAQFFGNFLLNNKYITTDQLKKAIEIQSNTHIKLGTLAINAGYMTSKQVEKVHAMQGKVDQRFGDLAIKMGYLTDMNVSELISTQQPAFLILGQTLINLGFMTNNDIEVAIADYKAKYSLTNEALTNDRAVILDKIIEEFYHFGKSNSTNFFSSYVSLLFNNIVRFIGIDFTPVEALYITHFNPKQIILQSFTGEYNAITGIQADESVLIELAKRYSGEEITSFDEYAQAVVSEFLNLHNGLFAVNMSNFNKIELGLTPQEFSNNFIIDASRDTFCIPFNYTFGTINFIVSL